jgi:aspartate/methionine/tyrosine aminotransferase
MYPAPFALERFFARHEFSARYLLSASDCQGPAMAELLAAADDRLRARWENLRLGYTESQGLPDLRAEIAALYGEVHAEQVLDAEKVLVAAPEEAIFLTMHALLAPGDHVICTFPGYQSLYELARSIGCEVDFWEPAEPVGPAEEGGWRFDPAGLETLIRPDTRLVVWNFPHNPTGALPSAGAFSRMVDTVARVGAWLFSDEMYRLLEPAPEWRLPAAADLYERAVSLAGMSKAFGLAGLRIGWVAARDQALLERIKSLKDYTTICSSAPSELLALMALRSGESVLAANVARIDRNIRAATVFFDRHRDVFSWVPPQAGTVCFPRLGAATGVGGGGVAGSGVGDGVAGSSGARRDGAPPGAEAFCARLLEKTGALLLPSTVYGYGDSHFRLGLGREDFSTGLEVLDAYLARDVAER